MKMRVWWIPQVPSNNPFHVEVESVKEAYDVWCMLAAYDLYQEAEGVKPDFSNAGGLEVFDPAVGAWEDWMDDETGEDFREYAERVFPSKKIGTLMEPGRWHFTGTEYYEENEEPEEVSFGKTKDELLEIKEQIDNGERTV